jgi:hypothetical protein
MQQHLQKAWFTEQAGRTDMSMMGQSSRGLGTTTALSMSHSAMEIGKMTPRPTSTRHMMTGPKAHTTVTKGSPTNQDRMSTTRLQHTVFHCTVTHAYNLQGWL